MKIGDRLYCIKDYISAGLIVNSKGKTYKIIDFDNYNIRVNTNYTNNRGCDRNSFILGRNDSLYNLYEYFIDLKEERTLKIKKLNEQGKL